MAAELTKKTSAVPLQFFQIAKTQFCKLGWFYQNTEHNSQTKHPQNASYILQNEALWPKLLIALSESNCCTRWLTLHSYYQMFVWPATLCWLMKSTLIFRMRCYNTNIVQIVENPSDCSHAQKYLQIHTCCSNKHLFFLFFTKQVSATCAQQMYLH